VMNRQPFRKVFCTSLVFLVLGLGLLESTRGVHAAESTATRGTNAAVPTRPVGSAIRRTPATTNISSAKGATGTNAAVAVPSRSVSTNSSFFEKFQALKQHKAFYPVLAAIPLALGLIFLILARKSGPKSPKKTETSLVPASALSRPGVKKRKNAAIHSCNILQFAPDAKRVWHFGVRNNSFSLAREQAAPIDEALPSRLIAKDWTNLWQRKVNIAWIPPEQVFLRVIQLPQSSFEETVSMVELQLEKLSPIPVAQIAWSIQILRHPEGTLQTVIAIIVARSIVEEFLGKLENDGYLADRLELPALDQLQATLGTGDGAWIYPSMNGAHLSALAAWRYGGVLQNLDLITLGTTNRAEALREQLNQLAWAGELDGWLTSPPSWHLVADSAVAAEWEPLLRESVQQTVEVIDPIPAQELARLTAIRAAQNEEQANLLPPEYALRYQQSFVDRLWMRALGATVGLYIAVVAVYLVALQVAVYRTKAVETEVTHWSPYYTNAMQLKARYQVLKDRQELKFAALDCWKAVAGLLPEEVTLDGYNFSDGKRLNLNGTAPVGQVQQLYNFEGAMRKVEINGQPLFAAGKGESLSYQTRGNDITWNFSLELKRSEMQ
jgi:hypothetical protein